MLLGKAATGRSSALSAAKTIRKKAVFCVDNVSTSCCVTDIRAFVSSQSSDVLTCFEVKPRRSQTQLIGRLSDSAFMKTIEVSY